MENSKEAEKEIIQNLILAREMGRQGYRWNRAFRKYLWKLVDKTGRPLQSRNKATRDSKD